MQHLALWIYLFGIADNISCFLIGVSVFLFVCTFISAGLYLITCLHNPTDEYNRRLPEGHPFLKRWDSANKKSIKYFNYLLILGLIFNASGNLIPDKKTMAAMIIIPKIAENKDIQKLPGNVAKALNNAVVSWSNDLMPSKNSK